MSVDTPLGTRAVLRTIEAGETARCAGCGEFIRFTARNRKVRKVVCNVYEGGVWAKVDQFHCGCYLERGEPYGEASDAPRNPIGGNRQTIVSAHCLSIIKGTEGNVQGLCRCQCFSEEGPDQDAIRTAYDEHVRDADPVLF